MSANEFEDRVNGTDRALYFLLGQSVANSLNYFNTLILSQFFWHIIIVNSKERFTSLFQFDQIDPQIGSAQIHAHRVTLFGAVRMPLVSLT